MLLDHFQAFNDHNFNSDHTSNNDNTVGLLDDGKTPNKNETNPNSEGLIINRAQADLTTGVTFSFLCFLSLISTTLCNLMT